MLGASHIEPEGSMQIRPDDLDRRNRYGLMISALVPRPIAWVSTLSPAGCRNLAPFSFFGGISSNPLLVGIAIGRRKGVKKDTLANLEALGEGVIHVATEELAEVMVLSSGDYPEEIDEFDLTGLRTAPSTLVRPERIPDAPVAMEFRVERILEVGDDPDGFVLARILLFHVREDLLEGGRIRPDRLHAIGRLGGHGYCRTRDIFEMPRPDPEREIARWKERS
jgi:flavin reductase (DIM6/NTAB) family NADH-FMN oxidoreductase RutF